MGCVRTPWTPPLWPPRVVRYSLPISRRPEFLFLESFVKSSEAHSCLVEEKCSYSTSLSMVEEDSHILHRDLQRLHNGVVEIATKGSAASSSASPLSVR
ncbi:hypothetical protein TNCV_1120381 [Trichonephila clavipes]|uniref:Uncharacterized protein n=1 Tax=Trichonephila clavipes TaxID=2585209 RepID=A0A8X6SVJ8_TRICX|nr:hypothetical protein TNCV_1120381 [Trichonephila clavipes]